MCTKSWIFGNYCFVILIINDININETLIIQVDVITFSRLSSKLLLAVISSQCKGERHVPLIGPILSSHQHKSNCKVHSYHILGFCIAISTIDHADSTAVITLNREIRWTFLLLWR